VHQIHKQPIHIRRPLILITLLSSPSPANCLLLTANYFIFTQHSALSSAHCPSPQPAALQNLATPKTPPDAAASSSYQS